jgi:2-dehydro-3-deoxygalactonokinase
MRGEETLVIGSGIEDGVVVLPGTHSKWVEIRRGRIQRFTTYLTGELFDLIRRHGFVGRLAEEPQDPAGFTRGLGVQSRAMSRATTPVQDAISALGLPGQDSPPTPSLLSALFEARAAVLLGRMHPRQVMPFLSGLLVGDEVAHGRAGYCGQSARVHVIAQEPLLGLYRQAFASQRIEAVVLSPEACLVEGLRRLVPGPLPQAVSPVTETGLPFLRAPFYD